MSLTCKVALPFLSFFAAASFLAFTALADNKTKQPSNNVVSH